jgi:activator of 2-hydroxyglutaryl-CoA dehydratase
VKQSTEQVKINSFCTVFAISEIIGMIKKGITLPNVITGIYNSVVERCMEMSPIEDYLIITGGVPDNHPEIITMFRKRFANTDSPERSQLMAAYGCVLLNYETK